MAIQRIKGTQKEQGRVRRAGRTSARIAVRSLPRLRVKRTNVHMLIQLQSPAGDQTFLQVSTTDKDFWPGFVKGTARTKTAEKLGEIIAKRAVAAGFKEVAFDRAGYKYHGVVKALADAARENGLEF
jgi:large subunit ribosomal protein L18